jgi:hypothetical protein
MVSRHAPPICHHQPDKTRGGPPDLTSLASLQRAPLTLTVVGTENQDGEFTEGYPD